MLLENTLEGPLNCEEIQPVHPKGNQSWVFIGRTDAEAKTPILWPPDVKNWLIGKDPDAGKDWRQEEKGTTEDEIVGWHHWPDGHEFEQVPGDGEGQWSLVCCSPWVHKQPDMIEGLNNSNKRKSKIKVHQSVMSVLFFMLCLCVFLLIFCPEGNWFYFLTTSTITLARKPSTYP